MCLVSIMISVFKNDKFINQNFAQIKMPFEYHVTCKESDSKKKVAAESKAKVIAAIQQRFDVQHDIMVQQPFEDDWLDVEDWNELSDGGKLRFLRKPITFLTRVMVAANIDALCGDATVLRRDAGGLRVPAWVRAIVPAGMLYRDLRTWPTAVSTKPDGCFWPGECR